MGKAKPRIISFILKRISTRKEERYLLALLKNMEKYRQADRLIVMV